MIDEKLFFDIQEMLEELALSDPEMAEAIILAMGELKEFEVGDEGEKGSSEANAAAQPPEIILASDQEVEHGAEVGLDLQSMILGTEALGQELVESISAFIDEFKEFGVSEFISTYNDNFGFNLGNELHATTFNSDVPESTFTDDSGASAADGSSSNSSVPEDVPTGDPGGISGGVPEYNLGSAMHSAFSGGDMRGQALAEAIKNFINEFKDAANESEEFAGLGPNINFDIGDPPIAENVQGSGNPDIEEDGTVQNEIASDFGHMGFAPGDAGLDHAFEALPVVAEQ